VNTALAQVPEPLVLAPNGGGSCLWCGSRRLSARRDADGFATVRCGACGSTLSNAPLE
jgi:hypothetical protein